MENELITLETAKIAKEKGFDEEGEYYYLSPDYDILMGLDRTGYNMYPTKKNSDGKGSIIIVTQSFLQKWLREEHKIAVVITPNFNKWRYTLFFDNKMSYMGLEVDCEIDYATYELALEDALIEGLKLIK